VIVSDNPLSFSSAKKIQDLTDTLEKRISQRYLIANMVKPERKELMHKRLSEFHIKHLCDIPYDPKLEESVFNGESLNSLDNSPAFEVIEVILKHIKD
jgi:CO dehydrogenase nickel-insertion accessory protein CooC1